MGGDGTKIENSAAGGGSIVLLSMDGSFPENAKVSANGGRSPYGRNYYGGNGTVSFENIF